MLQVDPPMELGQTLRGTDDGTTTGNLINSDKLGICHTFPRYPLTGGPTKSKSLLTGKPVTAVLLRNTAGFALLPKRLAQLSRTAGYKPVQECDGYSAILGNKGIVLIDPFLPAAGVADKDIFWGVISGACPILLPLLASDHDADIAVNDMLVAATGTTTGVTTSGRVTRAQFVNSTAGGTQSAQNAFFMAMGFVGRALSARTSQETTAGADILVDLAIATFGINR